MTEYEICYPNWWRFSVNEWWQYRELFWFLAWRDIKVRYAQTILGMVWAILQPMSLMILLSIFWKKAIHIDVGIPYPVFIYSGLILWGLFSSGISNASNSMINNENIIKKVYFPRIIVPTAAILVSFLDFAITLIFYFLLILYYGIKINIFGFLLCSALSLIIVILSTLGCGLFFAAANIRYRDARYAVPFLLQLAFFATPIIFPLAVINSKGLIFLLSMNPMAAAIHLARSAISIEVVDWSIVWIGASTSFIIFFGGFLLFKKNEIDCADII
jgi:lipopolysaccharide transport system permease protein